MMEQFVWVIAGCVGTTVDLKTQTSAHVQVPPNYFNAYYEVLTWYQLRATANLLKKFGHYEINCYVCLGWWGFCYIMWLWIFWNVKNVSFNEPIDNKINWILFTSFCGCFIDRLSRADGNARDLNSVLPKVKYLDGKPVSIFVVF